MSTKVEQRVVEMKFDNQEFERRVSGTLSTLDKLKQKLNLTGAAKGLEGIGASAKKVDMSGLAAGVETVTARFSALDVMGVTALANITNAAMNAGKRIIASLTIDPVKTGFSEYETQINAVQTIMANVAHKGKTLEDVNKALDELNKYADQTIYNFTEMTKNIGLFTNAGVDLDTAVAAIKGFSNAAAMAGTDSTRTAQAMYQLSQAMSSGKVMLRDWMSLEQANITGERFRETLMMTARAHGIAIDEMVANEGNLRDTLKEGWLTADLMSEALNHYTLSRETMTEAEQEAATQMLLANGYTAEQIDQLFDLGTEATNAATKVKTFSQLLNVLAETAQSGWAKTWQIIFGDFEEAKGLFTPLANFFQKIIDKISEARNKFLDSAFSKNFRHLLDGINSVTKSIQKGLQPMMDYAKVVDEIISGKWGNTEKRWNALTEAGYDWAHAQNLVNEKLGNSLRRTTSYDEAQQNLADTQVEMNEATIDQIIALTKLSDAELKAKGYTDEQIKSLRELVRVAKQLGLPLREFLEKLDEIDGRWLFLNTFKNAGQGLVKVFEAMKKAWREVFPPTSPDTLFNIIAMLHKFSRRLIMSDETADKLRRTMKGLFKVFELVLHVVSIPFKIIGQVLGLLGKVLKGLPSDILGVTAVIGDIIGAFASWAIKILDVSDIIEFLLPYLQKAAKYTKDWFEKLGDGNIFKKLIGWLKQGKDAVVDWFNSIKDQENIFKYIFDGLLAGVGEDFSAVVDFMKEVGKKILQAIKDVLGIHSPSTEFFEIGKNIVQGLFNGLGAGIKMVYDLLISIGKKIIEIVQNLDLGSILTIALGGGIVFSLLKFAQVIDRLTAPLEGLDDVMENAGKVVKKFGGVLSSFKAFLYAKALESLATGIAILAGSLAVLSLLNQKKLWSAAGVITLMIVLLGGLTWVVGKYGKGKGLELGGIALSLLGLSVAMAIMAGALKTISKIDTTKAIQTIAGFIAISVALILMIKALGKSGQDMAKLGGTLASIGVAMLLMAAVVRILGGMDEAILKQGLKAMAAFMGIIIVLMAATQLIGMFNIDVIGKAISKIGGAFVMMLIVAKIAGNMKEEELKQGIQAIVAFAGVVVALMYATQLVGMWNVDSIGKTILGIGTAMLMMALVARITGGMKEDELKRGIKAITAFGLIVVGLIWATKLATDKDLAKLGTTLLAISVAVGLLAITAALLSLIQPDNLKKGIIAVGFLSAFVAGLIFVTKYAQNFKGTMIAITVAIGILALAVGLLSIIDPTKLAGATTALGILLGMLALIIYSTKYATNAVATLGVIIGAIIVLSIALSKLAKLPAEQALAASASLSLLLGTMAIVMKTMSGMGVMSKNALLGILGIAALCATLYIVVDVLKRLGDVQNVAQNALALSAFMGMMALVLIACTLVGELYVASFGLAATGLLGMVALLGMLYMVVDILKRMSEVENAAANMNTLTTFLNEMVRVLTVLAVISPLLLVATAALTGLTGLMVVIGLLATGIGALMTQFPSIEKFLDKGIPVMVKLAGGIGEMLGAFMSSLMTGITSGLPKMGMDLSMFMANLTPFIMGARTIDSKMMDGVKSLAEAILLLTGADILQRITSLFGGETSIESFGKQLAGLGTCMNEFANNLGTFDDTKVASIDCACRGIKSLAEAAKAMPGQDGLWQKLAGEKSLAAFGDNLPGLAKSLTGFIENLGTFDDTKVATIECAGKALKALAQAAQEIPNEGGLWAAICGENSIATFGSNLPSLGEHLNGFLTKLGTFGDDKVTTVDTACKAIKLLADVAQELPNEGGLWGAICGDNSLAEFGSKLPKLGEHLAGFISNLGTFTEAQVATITSACNAIKAIAKLGEIDMEDTGSNLNSFGKKMVKFAKKIKEFVGEMGGASSDSITAAITKTNSLITMAQTVSATNIDSLNSFGKALKKVAKDGVNGFIKELSGAKPIEDAKEAMKKVLEAAIKGAEDKEKDVKDSFTEIAEAAVGKLCTKELKKSAGSAGKDLVKGFVKGIKDNKYLAEDAGSSIGSAALAAARRAIDSNSPSKEAMYIGNDFSSGFVIGVKEYGSKVYNTAYDVADQARTGLSKAVSRISAILDSDMDMQPTIRPVLDLSEVKSEASHLSSVFGNPSVGVMSNLNAISSGVNARLQNGSNRDVVSAINSLRKGLDNMPKGDTYNVNGVTYDDGSNIRDAVETIIRAAIIEGRS